MTKIETREARCLRCQTTWERKLHSSVNVTLDPSLKARVLSASIFRGSCPSCAAPIFDAYDCLYHDMNHAFMVSLTSSGDVETESKALTNALSSLPSSELYRLRVVTSVHDFIEKVLVLDAELNDGIVELLKVILPTQRPDLVGAMLRFQALDDAGALAFAVIRPNTPPEFAAVPRDYYEAVRTQAFNDLSTKADKRGEWLRIDSAMVSAHVKALRTSEPAGSH